MIWIEAIGAIVSALGVWLIARRRRLGWPVALASVAIYGWIFVQVKLYSDALLQGAFAVMIVYGWWRWSLNLADDGRVEVAPLRRAPALFHLALGALGAIVLGALMHYHTDAAVPWLDAALTAFSLVAQWWQARRHAAAWWLWIAVDTVYVGLFLWKGMPITALLYAGFLGLAAMGLREWREASPGKP